MTFAAAARMLQSLRTCAVAHCNYFVGVVEQELFFLAEEVREAGLCLLSMSVPLLRKVAALPFTRPLTSAVMTGFSAVPVILMGMPVAVEGLAAADVLFNFVRIFTPTLLSPLALVTLEIKWKLSAPEGDTVPLPVDSPRAGSTE